MKYLVSALPDVDNTDNEWAPEGEPVIPWYPSTLNNVFLSVTSFKQSPYAVVVDDPELDPNILADRLKKEYPGLPGELHEQYILQMALAANTMDAGTRVQIFITRESATLKVVGQDITHVLWEEQPLP